MAGLQKACASEMTAIASIAHRCGGPAELLDRMLAVLGPFGRDSQSVAAAGLAALGIVRSHDLPEDSLDRQPLACGGGRFTLVADCRIDNREDLWRELRLTGSLKAESDAFYIAAAFERWSTGCFERLRGEFAVAIWDAQLRRYLLARDPVGARPLFVHQGPEMIAVASMPAALHALPGVERRANGSFIERAVRSGGMFEPESVWEKIDRILPGHFGWLDWAGLEQERYWSPPSVRVTGGKRADYAEELRHLIRQAVARRLRGQHIVATHLSAGLDSSAITGAAADILAADGGRVVALTAAPREGYSEGSARRIVDESELASQTARLHGNVDHVIVRDRKDWASTVDDAFTHAQMPLLNLCNQSWWDRLLEEAQRRGVTVLMPGQIGNFAMSYDGSHLLSEPFDRRDWREFARGMMASRSRQGHLRQVVKLVAKRMHKVRGRGHGRYYPTLGSQDFPDPVVEARFDRALVRSIMRVDAGPYQKAALARWRVDVRDPSYDRDLLDFAARTPLTMFVSGGVERSLIRAAARGWVASAQLREIRRGYQGADWHEQLVRQWHWVAEQVDAAGDHPAASKVIDVARLQCTMATDPSNWHDSKVAADYRHALLRGVAIGHFIRRAEGANR